MQIRQHRLLKTSFSKISLLIMLSLAVFVVWEKGLEKLYLDVLIESTNLTVSTIKADTKLEIDTKKNSSEPYQIKVTTIIDGRKGSYPQEIGGLLQPFVIIISWQLFLFFVLNAKSALVSTCINVLIFLAFQVFFLILLTGYYTSDSQKYFYGVLTDTFYLVAIVLIIKDNILYQVFRK